MASLRKLILKDDNRCFKSSKFFGLSTTDVFGIFYLHELT